MKIYMITDIEGVNGVLLPNQCQPGDSEYEKARHLLTKEVNAAVEGALDAGADEVLVVDGHGSNSACNILLEELHESADLIQGTPWTQYLEGLDSSFDGMLCVGFHAMAGTAGAVYDHTMSWDGWVNMTINGQPAGEFALCAATAGYYGVPTILLTGDDKACQEAVDLIPQIETAEVKRGITRHCACMKNPKKTNLLIREAARKAVSRIAEIRPYQVEGPVEIAVEYSTTDAAYAIQEHAGRRKTHSRKVVGTGPDIVTAWNALTI